MRGNSMNSNNISKNRQVGLYNEHDPFRGFNQVMKGFGGFDMGDDMFSRHLMKPFSSPFENMMQFSDLHSDIHQKGKQGSYVCQTFVSQSKMGQDGRIHNQNYYQNSAGQHRGGNTISQKQQAYKNNSGVNRIAEERMFNDQGRKIIKTKNHNDIEQTNHYYNLDADRAHQFDGRWNQHNQQTKFLQNHQKYLQNYDQPRKYEIKDRQRQIQRQRQRQRRNQYPKLQNQYKKNQSSIYNRSKYDKQQQMGRMPHDKKYLNSNSQYSNKPGSQYSKQSSKKNH